MSVVSRRHVARPASRNSGTLGLETPLLCASSSPLPIPSCACSRRATTRVFGNPHTLAMGAGVLACLDGFMNIAMEQTEEFVDGQLQNKYGDCFIRGNNGALQLLVSSTSEIFVFVFVRTHTADTLVCC